MSLTQKAEQMWNKPDPFVFIICLSMAAVVLLNPNHFSEILHSSMYSIVADVLLAAFFGYMALIQLTSYSKSDTGWEEAMAGVLFIMYEAVGFFELPPEILQIVLALAFILLGIFGGCQKPD